MKRIKKNQRASQLLKAKPRRKVKAKKISERKKQSEDLQELVRTWNEDLCE